METITQRKVGEDTLTIIDVGNMQNAADAERFKEKVQGQTYMNFDVVAAPMMGNFHMSVQTTYDGTEDEIMGMFVYLIASLI